MRRLVVFLALLAAGLVTSSGIARGQDEPSGLAPGVDVVKVSGVVDPTMGRYVREIVQDAATSGSLVVLQIDSPGTFGDEALDLARFLEASRTPIVAWVGPAGARAEGGALFLLAAASLSSMAPGAGIGPAAPFDLKTSAGAEAEQVRAASIRALRGLLGPMRPDTGYLRMVEGEVLPAQAALDAGVVELVAPQAPGEPGELGLLRAIDGRRVRTGAGDVVLDTLGTAGRRPDVRFHDLGPIRKVLHAVGTPTAVYLLIVVAMWGIAFEFTQPGFGLAGMAGVAAIALAVFGLTVVPVAWMGLALILAGTGLQALDVVIRRVGMLTLGGTVLFAVGSWLAWRGVAPPVDLPRWLIALASIGGLLLFGFGMTVALRARERIRSQQVGLVGLVGEARGDLDPEGAVLVKGTLWRARSNDGRIPKGSRVRVRGIDGLILRVEPESGES
jgi:membrane-bound serine protease (ClpP class)